MNSRMRPDVATREYTPDLVLRVLARYVGLVLCLLVLDEHTMIATAGGTATNLVSRTWGTFPDNAGDWTILISFKYPSTPAAATNASVLNFFDGATDFSTPYLHLGSQVATGDLGLDIFVDGSHEFQSSFTAITNNAQNWVAVTYDASATTATLILNGTTIQAGTIDLSTVAWDSCFVLGHGLADTTAPVSAAYLRAWQSVLSVSQLTNEAASITPVVTSTLLFTNPFQTSVDLTDHKRSAVNHFTATGTVTTDTTDPLLAVVAAPPTNTTPILATTVTTDSAYFQDTLTAGAATNVWFKATAATGDKEWGAMAFGAHITGATYRPTIRVYEGLANAQANSPLVHSSFSVPVQFPVTPGTDYYFEAERNLAATPATLQLSILNALAINVPAGSLAIPDVTSGFPLIFLDQATAYPINWVNPFPPGEEVGILLTGNVLVQDTDINGVQLYNTALDLVATPAVASRFDIVGSNETTYVVAKNFGGADQFVLVDAQGTVDATTYSIGAGGLQAITLSPDASIAYIIQSTSSTNQPIKKFVLATTTLSTFAAGQVGFFNAPNLLGLSDGTVLVGYNTVPITACKILRYNADGSTANTYTLASTDSIERIAVDETGNYQWVWSQPDAAVSRFYKIKISDGTVATDLPDVPKYNDGIYQGSETHTPIRFGNSFSCPLWIVRVAPLTPTETFPIRRQRTFMFPSSDDNKNMQVPIVEILMRTGIGLTPGPASDPPVLGSDPQVMWQFSKDGGKTWSPERWVSAGKIGEYLRRVRILRATGNYRNGVGRITVSDPVDWQFLAALAPNGINEGSS